MQSGKKVIVYLYKNSNEKYVRFEENKLSVLRQNIILFVVFSFLFMK